MRTSIAITLIIAGTLLVLAPPMSDYMRNHLVADLMSRPGVTSVNLGDRMSELYRFGCWLAGVSIIATAVWASLWNRRTAEPAGIPAPTAALNPQVQ